MSNIITVDINEYLSNTDYLAALKEDKLCLISSRNGNEFSRIYEGDYIIKTKSNNIYVVNKETFDNME